MTDEKRRAEDRKMMLDPDSWPNWPLLPLKKFGKGYESAVLISSDDPEWPLFLLANMWDVEKIKRCATGASKRTVDEILDEGWTVD